MLTATLDGAALAWVDGGGLVTVDGASWALDWWIGADDRWYLPAREPSVRQGRLGVGPVVETTVRIPSGDARQTVYGALVRGRPATVLEIHNDSPVPVALALAIRPFPVGPHAGGSPAAKGQHAETGLRCVNLDDTLIRLDGGRVVSLPRPPAQSGGSATHDVLDDLLAGRELAWSRAGDLDRLDGSMANGAVLYPLPHRTSLRFLIVESGAGPEVEIDDRSAMPNPAEAPDAATVAAGWTSVVDAESGFGFPDPGTTSAVAGARARLLLAAPTLPAALGKLDPGSGHQLAALAVGGQRREVQQALDELAGSFPQRLGSNDDAAAAAEVVAAVAMAAELVDIVPEPALLEWAVQVVHVIERSSGRGIFRRNQQQPPEAAVASAKRGLARLADLAGDHDGAAQLLAELGDGSSTDPAAEDAWLVQTVDASDLDRQRAEASAAGSWGHDDPGPAARFVLAARSLLVAERAGEVELLPGFAASWRGGNVEAHRLPTSHGPVSFAVRWHGARPALLWELDARTTPSDGSGELQPRLRCQSLDPDWSSTESRGETLLAGAAEPLPDSPMPGDSFS